MVNELEKLSPNQLSTSNTPSNGDTSDVISPMLPSKNGLKLASPSPVSSEKQTNKGRSYGGMKGSPNTPAANGNINLPPIQKKGNGSKSKEATATNSARPFLAPQKQQNGANVSTTVLSSLSSSFAHMSLNNQKSFNGGSSIKQSRSKSSAAVASYNSLSDVVRGLKSGHLHNVILIQGAGVSTGSGIPDFRTKGTGLYSNLSQYNIPYPEAIFDIDYFKKRPQAFYTLAKELYPSGKYKPNVAHYLARILHEKQLLLRVYTQNIDGLERLAGVPPSLLVEAHGTFSSSSCIKCERDFSTELMKKAIFSQTITKCPSCKTGLVKPDITFFGEDLPPRFFLFSKDMPKADLIIVMGTSLEVEPFCNIIKTAKHTTPRLLLNRNKVGPFRASIRPTDMCLLGELESSVWDLIRQLGWAQDIKDLMKTNEANLPVYNEPSSSTEQQENNPIKNSIAQSAPSSTSSKTQGSQLRNTDSKRADSRTNESNSKNGRVTRFVPLNRNVLAKPNSIVRNNVRNGGSSNSKRDLTDSSSSDSSSNSSSSTPSSKQ